MGYMTSYTLFVKDIAPDELTRLNKELEHKGIVGVAACVPLTLGVSTSSKDAVFYAGDWCRWYTHEDDILVASREFPNATFMLEGDGESSDDYWREYFKNGETEICEGYVAYPEPKKIQWLNT